MIHDTTSPCELWNRMISHINYKSLPHVRMVVTRLTYLNLDCEGICKVCAKGKNTNNPFLNSDTKSKRILKLIHSGVCGPMPSTYLSAYVYYVTSIDDYSSKNWVYFLN